MARKEPRGLICVREKELSQQFCWLSKNFLLRNSAALHVCVRESSVGRSVHLVESVCLLAKDCSTWGRCLAGPHVSCKSSGCSGVGHARRYMRQLLLRTINHTLAAGVSVPPVG